MQPITQKRRNMTLDTVKNILKSLPTKKKQKTVLNFPVHSDTNVFGFGENHTITIKLKEEFSKRYIEFNIDNLTYLLSSLLSIIYSEYNEEEKHKQIKHLFLKSRKVPAITLKEKVFLDPEEVKWHSIYWGVSGKGKSYFTKQLLAEQIKCCLMHYLDTLLNFISENETNDKNLIKMNFEHDWNNFLSRIQSTLLKS